MRSQNKKEHNDFLEEFKPKIQQVLTKELRDIKIQLGLKVQLYKDKVRDSPTFYNKQIPITNEDETDF